MTETERERMRADVARGFARPQRQLQPKYFYDERGSELFDHITELPEYYLTRSEKKLIESFGRPWLRSFGACTLVELGAGSGEKTRLLLDALPDGAVYVPVDISESYLEQIAEDLGGHFPDLEIVPARADITRDFALPAEIERPLVVAFIGSTIGNFEESAALALLCRSRAVLEPGDRLLLGFDLRKPREILEAAYNDAQGVTADFNLNILRVLNRDLGADFDLDAWRHHAFWNDARSRVEMHLVSGRAQTVNIPGAGSYHFAENETIHTEISCKYDRPRMEAMLAEAGLEIDEWSDVEPGYALIVAAPR